MAITLILLLGQGLGVAHAEEPSQAPSPPPTPAPSASAAPPALSAPPVLSPSPTVTTPTASPASSAAVSSSSSESSPFVTTAVQLVADFADAAAWRVVSGSAGLSGTGGHLPGSAALAISYDLSGASQVSVGAMRMPSVLDGLPGTVQLDVRGDRSWNVMYVQVRDSTGEIFHYRLGSLGFAGWRTLRVDLQTTDPATTLWGNGDGVLDLPVAPFRVVVDRGPDPRTLRSTIAVANLRCACEPWTGLVATPDRFVASAGGRSQLRIGRMATPTAFRVVLTDEGGRHLTWAGTTPTLPTAARAWPGRDDIGRLMTGSVRARVTLTRRGGTMTVGIPFLAGIPTRVAGSGSMVAVNSFLAEVTPLNRTDAERQARLMEAAHVSMAREEFDWNRVEPLKGEYSWAVFDQAVEVSRAHNVALLGKLAYSAAWASSAPPGTASREALFYPPAQLADYLSYVRAVVTRYRDDVDHWEIWNEPNLWRFWRPVRDPAAYAAMLKGASAIIRQLDPGATVVLGGIVGTDVAYLNALRKYGAWEAFDVLNIHSFVVNAPEASGLVGWLAQARAYVSLHGTKPIWISELCWPTVNVPGSPHPAVTEAQQAAYVPRAYLVAAAAGASKVFWYGLSDHPSGGMSRYDYCGLLRGDGSPKPAYGTFRQMGIGLDEAVAVGPLLLSKRAPLSGLDATTGWSVAGIDGGRGALAASTPALFGPRALRLGYTFGATSTGVTMNTTIAVPGTPTSLSVWTRGDGSANPVYMSFTDVTGERFSGTIGSLQSDWQRLTMHLDGGTLNWSSSGGDRDGRVDYPVTVRAISVYRAGIGVLAGTASFDGLEANYGESVRGVVFTRRGQTMQALYSLASQKVRVPITGTTAQLMDYLGWRSLAVPTKVVEMMANPVPRYLVTGPELLPATITPNGDGRDDSTIIRWASGDGSRATLQVYALNGRLLRTVRTGTPISGGMGSMRWDGRLADAAGRLVAAPVGSYQLRITVRGPDGRHAILAKTVVVRAVSGR